MDIDSFEKCKINSKDIIDAGSIMKNLSTAAVPSKDYHNNLQKLKGILNKYKAQHYKCLIDENFGKQYQDFCGNEEMKGKLTTTLQLAESVIDNYGTDVVDIFNSVTMGWSVDHLSVARNDLTAASSGSVAIFAGGSTSSGYSDLVDIYEVTTGQWSTSTLSVARRNATAVTHGTNIYIAGGITSSSGNLTSIVDIYDVSTGTWSTDSLSAMLQT